MNRLTYMWPLLTAMLLSSSSAEEIAPLNFAHDIRPILVNKCFHCHGRDEKKREGELRLDVEKTAKKSAIVPGNLSKSEFHLRIHADDADEVMPPPDSKLTLSKNEKELLDRWIQQGAPYSGHWAFEAPVRPDVPVVKKNQQPFVQNEVDHFILNKLQAAGLEPSPPASRETLIRRVTLDLTGLPPTPDEVDTFVADKDPQAYSKVIDRLLASPRYAEHMATYWLEAARYADTDGYQNDRYRYMHVWRDWVIMAFRENMPHDQFIIEQLAGDLLPKATLKQQIATGFCRNHRINSEAGSLPAEWHVENVVDRVDTFGTVFLGLTLSCVRCHEHKYDPISHREYYELFAFFNNVPESGVGPNNGNSPPFIKVPASWPNLTAEEDHLIPPGPLEFQKGGYGGGVVRPKPGDPTTVMVMAELEKPRATYLLQRGQYDLPDKSEKLQPSVPTSLNSFGAKPTNRLGLAQWLVDPRHPLTTRVAVNRYWQQFFGVGLVKTTENFGVQGEPPSHPELLDWLALEFIRLKWDVRALQKTILLSASYRQSSRVTSKMLHHDPENRLLARGPRFRPSAFVLRDQALAVSGLLLEKQGGPPAKPYMPAKIWKAISNNAYKQDHGEGLYRRSLYTYWRRTIPPPTMVSFNAANREFCQVRNERSNTPLQALTLMNNVVFMESSRFLAERMLRHSDQLDEQLTFGFRLATSRKPDVEDLELLQKAYQVFQKRFNQDTKSAEALLKTGEKPRDATIPAGQHAAMTMTASIILNLDETITKE